ncbi:hypothetical protein ABG768_025394 [Culter alburnus]|uniref:Uncharacterized protein n=1 Tax=Culter alburnus TaxID=194366 RepID=A0AAW2AG73_CULAL
MIRLLLAHKPILVYVLLEKQENKVDKWVVMTETYMLLAELSRKCHHLHLFVTVGHSKMAVLSNCHSLQGFEAQSAGCECPFTCANKQNVNVLLLTIQFHIGGVGQDELGRRRRP